MGSRSIEPPADVTWEERVAAFRHPNVVTLTRSGDWYIIDRRSGLSLADLQRLGVVHDQRQTLRILLDALVGLDAVHRFGSDGLSSPYVHGELCPASIVAGRDGAGRVVPIPTRRLVGAALHDASGYLAPEKLLGDALDQRADVFSAGVLLWEAVSMRRLFPDGRGDAVVTQLMGGKMPPLHCPPHAIWATALEPLVTRALAVDPGQRWPSIAVMLAQMEDVTRGELALPRQVADLISAELEPSPSARPGSGSSNLTPMTGLSGYESGSSSAPPPAAPPSVYARHLPPPPGQIAWEHAGQSSRPPRAMVSDRAHSKRQAKIVGVAIAISVIVAAASAYVLIFADSAQPPRSTEPGSILVTPPNGASAPVLELPPAPAEPPPAATPVQTALVPAVTPAPEPRRITAPAARPALTPVAPAARPAPASTPVAPARPANPVRGRPDPKDTFGI